MQARLSIFFSRQELGAYPKAKQMSWKKNKNGFLMHHNTRLRWMGVVRVIRTKSSVLVLANFLAMPLVTFAYVLHKMSPP